MKRLLFLLIIMLCALPAQALLYKIQYLTADEGLSRNMVNQIYRDSQGFIWISTSYGLDRYDGYDFVHFNNRNGGNNLLSDNVHAVVEDVRGNLWIATENGINYLNYRNGRIQNADDVIQGECGFQNVSVNDLVRDDTGNIWAVTDKGVVVIQPSDTQKPAAKLAYSGKSAVNTLHCANNSVFLGIDNHVFRLIKNSKNEYSLVTVSEKLKNLAGYVTAIFDEGGSVWVGTSLGLYKYDSTTETIFHYRNAVHLPGSLSSNTVTDIRKSKNGQLIVATLIGINIYDYRTDSFQRISTDASVGGVALNNNFVSCLFADEYAIWVGTEKGGVNILTQKTSIFNNVYHVPSNIQSIPANPVNAIYEDRNGDLWIGTVEGGLSVRRKGSEAFTHYRAMSGNTKTLSHNSVSFICQDFNNDYWIATWGRGINRMRYATRNKPVFEQFSYSPNQKNGILNDFVAAIAPDDKNKALWVGTRNGLDYFDISSGTFTHLLNYLPDEQRLKFITGMYIDSKRRLWIGTANGLFCVYPDKTSITQNRISYQHFRYELMRPHQKRILKINCILETKDGKIWFGSNGQGIYSLTEIGQNLYFRNYTESDGLLDNVVYGMLEDAAGQLWLSTDKGLCAFDPNLKTSRKFTKADGLISNQFYWDSYCKGSDGKMYFGNIAGFTFFDPLKFNAEPGQCRTTITHIRVLNESIYPLGNDMLGRVLEFENKQLKAIRLNESDKSFSIEFSSLNHDMVEKIKYAYRLKGFTNNWTEVDADRRFANFTNISYGKYQFEVKCTNFDGSWSEQTTLLQISVVPPFYKTLWFFVLLIGLIISLAYTFYRYRINLLQRQKAQLKLLVDERTREIEEQKQQLELQASQLTQSMDELMIHQEEVSRQNEMLLNQNQKITLQKEQLLSLSKKVQEANIDKIAFFTNITHEFRTPITLILGPVERALKLSTNPSVLEQLHIVKRNSRLLLSLINQLMDFRKVDSGKMELVKTQQNFLTFLDDIIFPFEDLVQERGIEFIRQYRMPVPEFLFDKDNMQKVITNLLSNAIKFTPDKGTITVVASTYTDRTDRRERLYVAVKDTGMGVPPDEQDKIFDRFYQSRQNKALSANGQSGTGIGLYLCKRIIQLHGGKIDVRNLEQGGSSFRFIVPIERRLSMMVSENGNADEMYVADAIVFEKDEQKLNTKNKPLLLIVEDNTDMRLYIKSILNADFYVIESKNGSEGLELTKRYQPDLIISDIMMPVMDGIAFCREVKNNFTTSHIPVILLTAKSGTDTQIESFTTGADAFMVKPFDEDLLKAIIQNLSDKRNRKQLNFAESMDAEALKFNDESPDKQFIDKALRIIRENYTDPAFDVAEFIDMMGISRSLLHKKLKNLAGQSASRFIRIYRLNIAREVIIKNRETHSLNISEIAYKVGFNDPKYFTRCFTKHFGIQPSTFLDEDAG